MYSKVFLPASILAGMIIGAGMFSLPYVFREVGLATGFFYLVLFSAINIIIYFLYADFVLRTEGEHRFVGYSKIYLGKTGFIASFFVGLAQLFFVLAIYLVLAPSFSKLFIGGSSTWHFLIFWVLGSAVAMFNAKRIALSEFLITGGMIAIVAIIFGFCANASWYYLDWGSFNLLNFKAAGPILFALSGSIAVPEMVNYFKKSNISTHKMKKALLIGGILPAVIYGVFILAVLKVSFFVSEDAVSGLIGRLPQYLLVLIGILGLLSIISSYIMIGKNLRKILTVDIGLTEFSSRMLVIFTPLVLYLINFKDFIRSVSFVGGIFLTLEGLLIILIWVRVNKKLSTAPVLVGNVLKYTLPFIAVILATILFREIF